LLVPVALAEVLSGLVQSNVSDIGVPEAYCARTAPEIAGRHDVQRVWQRRWPPRMVDRMADFLAVRQGAAALP